MSLTRAERFRAKWLRIRPWRRHSLVLLIAGMVYISLGWTYALTESTAARKQALQVPLSLAPMPVWGAVFVVVGCLAVLSSRWPPASETWGYTAMSSLSALWMMFYVWGMVLGAPSSSLVGAFTWAIIGFMWWAISGLLNPDDLQVKQPPSTDGG